MQSKVSITYEIDDLEQAADELIQGIDAELLTKKSICGILFCFSDMDHDELLRLLKERFPYDIIGGTCIAHMDRTGFHDMAASLTVLAADDCEFSCVVSERISSENVKDEVRSSYERARASLSGDPGLIVAFPPYDLNIMLDAFTAAFNTVASGVPMIGGIPSYNERNDSNLTFSKEGAHRDKLVTLLISGNVKPVFVIQNVSGSPVERKRKVTRSKNNVIYSAGSQSFVDYLREVGLPVEKILETNATLAFVSHPLLLENVDFEGESSYSFVRSLHKIDLEEGSATAIGAIPEGATVSICSLHTEQIQEAAAKGMSDLVEKMNATPDYTYSTVLAVSCIGRYLLIAPNSGAEADQLLTMLPPGVELTGFYSYGEIAPVRGANGKRRNFAHNESLALCAF